MGIVLTLRGENLEQGRRTLGEQLAIGVEVCNGGGTRTSDPHTSIVLEEANTEIRDNESQNHSSSESYKDGSFRPKFCPILEH